MVRRGPLRLADVVRRAVGPGEVRDESVSLGFIVAGAVLFIVVACGWVSL